MKDLQEKLGAAKLKEEALKAAIEEKDSQIEELEAQVSNPSVKTEKEPVIPSEMFTVDGKRYKFNIARFWFDGVCCLAENTIHDEEILIRMVERNVVGVFEEVKE